MINNKGCLQSRRFDAVARETRRHAGRFVCPVRTIKCKKETQRKGKERKGKRKEEGEINMNASLVRFFDDEGGSGKTRIARVLEDEGDGFGGLTLKDGGIERGRRRIGTTKFGDHLWTSLVCTIGLTDLLEVADVLMNGGTSSLEKTTRDVAIAESLELNDRLSFGAEDSIHSRQLSHQQHLLSDRLLSGGLFLCHLFLVVADLEDIEEDIHDLSITSSE